MFYVLTFLHFPPMYTGEQECTAYVRHEGENNRYTRLGNSKFYYSDNEIIGHGATAIVYKGYFGTPAIEVAVKRLLTKNVEIAKSELENWKQISHRGALDQEGVNVIRLFDSIKFPESGHNFFYFASELADKNLKEAVTELKISMTPNSQPQIRKWLRDTATGLRWIHSNGFMHGDIKPENVLICKRKNGGTIAKVGDFGSSRKMTDPATLGTGCMRGGNENWMAPEVIRAISHRECLKISCAPDIFSFGMLCQYAYTLGSHPFEDSSLKYLYSASRNIADPSVRPLSLTKMAEWFNWSEFATITIYEADHLFGWMMTKEPEHRPEIGLVLNHPFFWKIKNRLDFIIDVAQSVTEINAPEMAPVQVNMDSYFRDELPGFNWVRTLGDRFLELIVKRNENKKRLRKHRARRNLNTKIEGDSITALLKIIRDKNVHPLGVVKELITQEYFGLFESDNWILCKKKYILFYCKHFPNLLMLLFLFFVNPINSNLLLAVRKEFKLDDYTTALQGHHNWKTEEKVLKADKCNK